jgi:DNA-binding NtrC family response regulator
VEGLRSGAIDYLMKPVSVDDLIFMAESAFARRQIIEEKIRSAQARQSMGQSADDTLNQAGGKE